MFEFTIHYKNGNILKLKECNPIHAKRLKKEFNFQFDIGLIEGFSVTQNGIILCVCTHFKRG